jgi:hypothetical protein
MAMMMAMIVVLWMVWNGEKASILLTGRGLQTVSYTFRKASAPRNKRRGETPVAAIGCRVTVFMWSPVPGEELLHKGGDSTAGPLVNSLQLLVNSLHEAKKAGLPFSR